MMDSLTQSPFWRDTWGAFDPIAHAQLAPLAFDPCYIVKYYKAPDDDQEIIPAGAHLQYGLEVTPGSIIWGIAHSPASGNYNVVGFTFKLTSMDLGLEIWDNPTPDTFVSNPAPGPYPWLLNSPMPSVGKGLFKVDFWNIFGAPLRCNLVFLVAEVNQCGNY